MGFEHDALLYDSPDELAAVAGSFLLEGLALGEAAVIAVSEENTGLVREAVRNDPRVVVLERRALYRSRTPTAITTFRKVPTEYAAPGARARVVGEVDFGTTVADRREWQRYESVINHAFAGLPLTGLCVFDTQRLPQEVLDTAVHTHPHRRGSDGRVSNPGFIDPARYVTTLPVPVEPMESTTPALAVEDVSDFIGLRHTVRDRLAAVDGPDDLIEDFLLAVDEMASNAVRHGRPPVGLQLWVEPGTLVCTIRDSGRGWDDPFAGYGPAHGQDLSHGGMGLWLARQLCDHVAIRRDEAGNSVRLTTHWS
ncbi:anti-sigma factor RsbA family regulatory protein [Modestobacter sp. SYSU DS0511]